jgi:hypothetical protein
MSSRQSRILPTHRTWYSLVLLGTAAIAGCASPEAPQPAGPALAPSYTITPPAPLTRVQGGEWSQPTVNLARSNFGGYVTLSVENLPTGVQAFFYPFGRVAGSSAQLWLYVAGDAPTGTFTNLLVRGVASGLADRTAPLTLTITQAPFVLSLSSPALSIADGATQTTTVNVVRNNFTDPVTLYVDQNAENGYPEGVTVAFAPNPTTGNSSVLSLTDCGAAPGVYYLWVYGKSTTATYWVATLTLTVLSP